MGAKPFTMGTGLNIWADAQLAYLTKLAKKAKEMKKDEDNGLVFMNEDDLIKLYKGESMRVIQDVDRIQENSKVSDDLKNKLLEKHQMKVLKNGQKPAVSDVDVRRHTRPKPDQTYCPVGKTRCDNHVISDDEVAAHGCRAAGPHQSVPQIIESWERCPVMNRIIFTEDQYQAAYKEFQAQLDKGMTDVMAGRIFCSVCKKYFDPKGEKVEKENGETTPSIRESRHKESKEKQFNTIR